MVKIDMFIHRMDLRKLLKEHGVEKPTQEQVDELYEYVKERSLAVAKHAATAFFKEDNPGIIAYEKGAKEGSFLWNNYHDMPRDEMCGWLASASLDYGISKEQYKLFQEAALYEYDLLERNRGEKKK